MLEKPQVRSDGKPLVIDIDGNETFEPKLSAYDVLSDAQEAVDKFVDSGLIARLEKAERCF